MDPRVLAQEIADAYRNHKVIAVPPTRRDAAFDVKAGYAVEAELARMRRAGGHVTVGRKVGFANKAQWRVFKLETLTWAHMYDDTVRYATAGGAAAKLAVGQMFVPKIEPEIVFKINRPVPGHDPAAVLAGVEWIALGFEVIDCVFGDYKQQPADLLASFGLHAALVVGEPRPVRPEQIATLVDELATFTATLRKDGQLAAEGAGRNCLRSPALCLGELAAASAAAGVPLERGELISSGTLSESQPIAPGQVWTATVAGLDLPPLSMQTTA